MIFVGDIALGEKSVKLELLDDFFNQKVIGNLEGGIIKNDSDKSNIVFNSKINKDLFSKFYLFCLANNHIFDDKDALTTINFLNDINIPFIGLTGKNHNGFFEDKENIYLNFGWSVIEAKGKKNGYKINPLTKKNVTSTVKRVKEKSKKKIICIFHWGYELELYPQPLHRELSHQIVDLGVSLIIGHHSHRVQGIEVYKGVPIVYGLGNFLFSQNLFYNGRLKFPLFCDEELAFEYNHKNEHCLYWFVRKGNDISYCFKENLQNSEKIAELTPFKGMNHDKYVEWFKKNRTKSILLPIYLYSDSTILNAMKNLWVYVRQFIITVLVKIKIKNWR